MDFIKKALDGEQRAEDKQVSEGTNSNQEHHGFNLGDTINGVLGGGKKSEENEDMLDKAVDAVQEYVLGQGQQSNESAAEQFKDEQISDAIRDAYKNTTGKDLPVNDKEH